MADRKSSIRALAKRLGKEYRVTTIDFEPVVYRVFENGYNVEISGMFTTSKKKKATIYLWDSEKAGCRVVKIVKDVAQDDIGSVVEALRRYSESISKGKNKEDKEHE